MAAVRLKALAQTVARHPWSSLQDILLVAMAMPARQRRGERARSAARRPVDVDAIGQLQCRMPS